MAAGILIGTAVIFVVFGSGQIQKWNKITEDVDEMNTTNNDNSLKISLKF